MCSSDLAQQLEKDQATREETLKARKGKVAQDKATYAERFEKANASLSVKQKKMQEEADDKVKLIRQNLSKDYDEKAKKQEERFMVKRNELQNHIKELEKGDKQIASRI